MLQVSSTERGRHQLAQPDDVRVDARADLPHEAYAGHQPLDFLQVIVEQGRPVESQALRQRIVQLAQRLELRHGVLGNGRFQDLLEVASDLGDRRMHDDRPQSALETVADQGGYFLPVVGTRDGRTAEFHDYQTGVCNLPWCTKRVTVDERCFINALAHDSCSLTFHSSKKKPARDYLAGLIAVAGF